MLHPAPRIAPFVTNSPPTLLVAQLERICEPPSNEQANKAAFREPIIRINLEFIIAPKATKEMEVEPMKARVESAARFSDASLACISPQL